MQDNREDFERPETVSGETRLRGSADILLLSLSSSRPSLPLERYGLAVMEPYPSSLYPKRRNWKPTFELGSRIENRSN